MVDKPSDPPRSLEEALNWARYLQGLDPGSREVILAGWNPGEQGVAREGGTPSVVVWKQILRAVFAESKTLLILELQSLLLRNGMSKRTVERGLVAFSELNWVQKRWSDWTDVKDRGELRLRLFYLSHTDTLQPSLEPFLTFFFRASDPALYQQAAIALGRHLLSSTELLDYLLEYVEFRGLSLSEPLTWIGQRPQRRTVLTVTSCMANHPDQPFPVADSDLPRVPFEIPSGEGKEVLLPDDPADTGVYLTCLRLMNRSEKTRARVEEWTWPVLRRFTRSLPYRRTREVQEKWGRLFAGECHRLETKEPSEPSMEQILQTGADMHRSIVDEIDGGQEFGSYFRAWRVWDEYIHTLATLSESHIESMVQRIEPGVSGPDFNLIHLRLITWLTREGERNSNLFEKYLSRLSTRDSLPPLLKDVPGTLLGDWAIEQPRMLDPAQDSRLDSFSGLMEPLSSRSSWKGHTPRMRALLAFFILDFMSYQDLPEEQLQSLLERQGFTLDPDQANAQTHTGMEESPSKRFFVQVLSRLQTWEHADSESFLDTEMIHEIADLRLLLTMIPSHRPSVVLPVLADAFEHQLRISLRQDATLDPTRFLSLISIRDPHPSFFQYLSRVCSQRTYQDARDRDVPLQGWIRVMRQQIEEAQRLPDEHLEMDTIAFMEQGLVEPGMEDTHHSRRTRSFRKKIRETGPITGDPRDVLHRFLELVGVPHEGRSPRPETILGMLRILHPADGRLLQSGYPARRTETLQQLEQRVGEQMVRLEHLVEELTPLNWLNIEAMDQTVGEIRDILEAWNQSLLTSLPYTEERAIEGFVRQLDDLLLEWVRNHEALNEVMRDVSPVTGSEPGKHIRRLLEEIDRQWTGNLRAEVKSQSYVRLRSGIVSKGPTSTGAVLDWSFVEPQNGNPWQTHRLLLDTALDQAREELHASYRSVLFESWKELLGSSMEDGATGRAIELLTGEQYEPVRRDPDAIPSLENGRDWALDRYRLGVSRSIGRELSSLKDHAEPTAVGEIGRFLNHFSPVWLALLVGAIFMLDFGDPWTAMAEKGDHSGILITFLLGLTATFLYVFVDLRGKEKRRNEKSMWTFWDSRFLRASLFLCVCLVYTFLVVLFLWYLLSGTEQVVRGPFAFGHIVVWTGFALFFGVFLGLIAQQTE